MKRIKNINEKGSIRRLFRVNGIVFISITNARVEGGGSRMNEHLR